MQTKTLKAWALASTLIAGAGVSAPAFAQDSDDSESAPSDRIVVTGSRLQTNPNLVSASPVLSVSGEEADIRGNVRIEDFVNILPQVFAGQAGEVSNGASGTANLNLRGLGANRTLVLIDGRRLPFGSSQISAANLDIIPTQLVERVDILTGGASAVYGSDAVGGVANFILRDDFQGLEIEAHTQVSNAPNGNNLWDNVLRAAEQPVPGEVWDGEEYSLTMLMGTNTDDGRGNATIFASYEKREAITQDNRSISGCALGQTDPDDPFGFGSFGCIGSSNFRGFGTSADQDPTSPTFGLGGFGFQQEDGTIVDLVGGPQQTYNFGPLNYFQRPSERFQIYGRAHYDIADDLRAFADISFVHNISNAQIAETASFGSWDVNCDNPLLQGNPGIPFTDLLKCTPGDIASGAIKSGVFASHRNVEGGPRNSDLENMAWRFVGGLQGTFADHWDWEAFYQFARTDDTQVSKNDFIVENVQQALLVTTDPATGDPVCIDPSGGCVPYNIWQRGPGGESLITPEQTNFLQGTGIITGTTEQRLWGANVQADLGNYGVSSPMSDLGVGFLVGFENRKDILQREPDEIFQVDGGGFTGLGGATKPVFGEVDVFEIFSELQVPIVTGAAFAEELTFSAQYRYSDYETQGGSGTAFSENEFTTDSYALQLTWAPTSDVRFRGQFQQAVRAPTVIELYTANDVGLPNLDTFPGATTFDPCAGATPFLPLSACANTGVTAGQYGGILDVISGQTQSITGGNPDLDPETAETLTLGVVFTPSFVDDLSITIDYFDITVEDAVGVGASPQRILEECLTTGDPGFCNLVSRADNGTLASGFGTDYGFIQTNRNVAELTTSGVDVQVNYAIDLADITDMLGEYGSLRFDYAATFLDDLVEIPFEGADPIQCAGFFGNACASGFSGTPAPEYRHRLMATWETPWNADISATWRHFGSTDNKSGNELEPELPAIGYLDLSGNYQVLDNVVLRGGILNAFAEQAPVFTSAGPPLGNGNTYPTVYDTSRVFFASVTANF